ncbi:MAG: phosphoheptose isomerase [Chlamydiae bacterium RIFCSPHIGHO2_12_FULL_49_11]|nr:MAG: phosphoheptose isomerase [Chlamydiae bacterium RIFCSPHIGHO2_12_FULL_49_11]
MKKAILESLEKAVLAVRFAGREESLVFIEKVVLLLAHTFETGKKVIIAGNGGSLCDAMHFAEELTGFFRGKRKAFPAIALSDPSHMSCVANDVSFDHVFARSIEALGVEGDVFIALSTSGNSKNLIRAAQIAKAKRLHVVGFLGKTGGELKDVCDLAWVVHGFSFSDRIQEAHMVVLHIIVEMIEEMCLAVQA